MSMIKKYLWYLIEWKDYFLEEITIKKSIYDLILDANNKWNEINNYIYDNFYLELLDYQEISNKKLKEYLKKSFWKINFLESNFINRWDFFITQDWIKTTEINNDTPWWYCETVVLNQWIENIAQNPNYNFLNNFLIEIKKLLWIDNGIFLLWSISYREDYKIMQILFDFLNENWINTYIWMFEELEVNWNKVNFKWNKIKIIFKYYPIDWVYESFDMTKIEKMQDEWNLILLNNQSSYLFQLKSYFSFLWENIDKFDINIQKMINYLIPMSIRMDNLSDFDIEKIINQKDNWVLKDINNREWRGIYVWERQRDIEWTRLINKYKWNKNYIIQERIKIKKINWFELNLWVYNIKNNFSWILTRLSKNETDINCFSLPIKIDM